MAGLVQRTSKQGEPLWYATIHIGGGANHWEPIRERDGSAPADRKRAQELANLAERNYRKLAPAKRTAARRILFTTAWPTFVADYVSTKAKNTQNDYHWAYEGHFRKAPFARKRVTNITHEDIKAYVQRKQAQPDPLGPHTLNNHTGMLAKFFQWAQQQGYWDGPVNPAKAMGIRQRLTTKHVAYLREPEHQLLLIDSIVTTDQNSQEKYRLLVSTLLWAGIRWSEARSLLWSQVKLDNPKHLHLRITTTAVGMDIQSYTKSPAGDRYVGVCPTLAAMLKQWRANPMGGTLASEKFRLGIDPSDGLVLPSDAGTMLSPGNFRRRQLKDAKEAAHKTDPSFPLDLTTHGLRHSYAMTLLRMGATNYQVGQELGHSKGPLGSTAAYTHVDAERANPIAAAMVEKSIKVAKQALKKKQQAAAKSVVAAPVQPLVASKGITRPSPKPAAARTAAAKASLGAKPRTASAKSRSHGGRGSGKSTKP